MNETAPFGPEDLAELDERIYSRASAVVAKREVAAGNHDHTVVAARHDCDAEHSLGTAVKMAEWEADRGYRATYYVLHTSPYWNYPNFRSSLERIALLGHEIGIHANALAEALRTGEHPDRLLEDAIEKLRGWGHKIVGVAGHGDPICRASGHETNFANDEQFVECARPKYREERVDRGYGPLTIVRGNRVITIEPRPLADFGLEYEAIRVSAPAGKPIWRVSDSGGRWKHVDYEPTFDQAAVLFDERLNCRTTELWQLQVLVHPDWWANAFVRQAVAA